MGLSIKHIMGQETLLGGSDQEHSLAGRVGAGARGGATGRHLKELWGLKISSIGGLNIASNSIPKVSHPSTALPLAWSTSYGSHNWPRSYAVFYFMFVLHSPLSRKAHGAPL